MAEAVWAARWLRGLAAEGKTAAPAADAEPASASAGNPVDPAPAGEPVAQVTPPATPAADAPWYVQCLLGLSAWLATLLLLLFIGLSQIVNTQEGALVAGLVLCAAGVASCAARPVRSGGSAARRWPLPASCWSFRNIRLHVIHQRLPVRAGPGRGGVRAGYRSHPALPQRPADRGAAAG